MIVSKQIESDNISMHQAWEVARFQLSGTADTRKIKFPWEDSYKNNDVSKFDEERKANLKRVLKKMDNEYYGSKRHKG